MTTKKQDEEVSAIPIDGQTAEEAPGANEAQTTGEGTAAEDGHPAEDAPAIGGSDAQAPAKDKRTSTYRVTGGVLRIREEPGLDGKEVPGKRLPRGSIVDVDDACDAPGAKSWLHCKDGWFSGDFAEEL